MLAHLKKVRTRCKEPHSSNDSRQRGAREPFWGRGVDPGLFSGNYKRARALLLECELYCISTRDCSTPPGRVSFPSPQKDPDWDGPTRGGLKRWWTLDTMTNPLNTVDTVYTVDRVWPIPTMHQTSRRHPNQWWIEEGSVKIWIRPFWIWHWTVHIQGVVSQFLA